MKKVAMILAVLALVLMVAEVGMAADKKPGGEKRKRPDGIRGKVVAVKDGVLTITPFVRRSKDDPKPEKPENITVETDDDTEVIIDREKGKKVSDLAEGNYVFITPKEGKAKRIIAFTKRPTRKPKGPKGGKKKPDGEK